MLQLHIISPTGEVFNGSVAKVLLPGTKAPFVVLRHHAPLISSLTAGRIAYTAEDGSEGALEISGGFVEVRDDRVVVCTE
jgi:F-type H+-transporting ATPase subunit epsilon